LLRPVLATARRIEGGTRPRAVGIGLRPDGAEHVPLAGIVADDAAKRIGECLGGAVGLGRGVVGGGDERQAAGPEAVIRKMLDSTGYWKMLEDDPSPDAESRLQNLSELINAAAEATERGESLTEFLDHAALVSDADSVDEQAQVSLLTMHNAKGLEFPVVFVAGLEEGLFPHSRSRDNEDALEEERRLCYVGFTRARKILRVSWCEKRQDSFTQNKTARYRPSMPSRFLERRGRLCPSFRLTGCGSVSIAPAR